MSDSSLKYTEEDNPNRWVLFWVILLTGVLLVGTSIWALHLYKTTLSNQLDYVQDNAQKSYALRKTNLEAEEKISQYRWLNKQQGKIQISIDVAMEIIADDYEPGQTAQ